MLRGGKKKLRGGHSPGALSPAPYADGTNVSNSGANYLVPSNRFPTTQVGGGYGFVDDVADIPSFAGSYFPVSKVCTANEFDASRGGNNFMSGGTRRRSTRRRCGGSKKYKQKGCKGKRSRGKRSRGKRSRGKRSGSKKNKKGGLFLGGKRSRSKRSRSKRSRSRKQRGGNILL